MFGKTYRKLGDNSIKTSKYSLLTFVPLNLVEQFSKISNVYFLVLVVMQCIKIISTSGGVPTILPSLLVIISISAFKDFLEDYKRWVSDKQENNRRILKFEFNRTSKASFDM